MNLVDSSGWLEYFTNAPNAPFFMPAIEDTDNLIVSTINIYEVYKKVLNQIDKESARLAIGEMHKGRIITVSREIAVLAAELSLKFKLPLADSMLYASAIEYSATFWTQDKHFENIPDVKYIKKTDGN